MASLSNIRYAYTRDDGWYTNPKWTNPADYSSGSYGDVNVAYYTNWSGTVIKYFLVYSAQLDLSGARNLKSCILNIRLRAAQSATNFRCYLFTSDPTANNPSSRPSGHVATADISVPADSSGSQTYTRTFSFSGLSVSGVSVLYFWIEGVGTAGSSGGMTVRNNYELPTITGAGFTPLPSAFTVNPTSVATGGNISISITNAAPTETVQFYYGNTLLGSSTISNGYGTVVAQKSWFNTAGITTAKSMTVRVKIAGTSLYKDITLTAGNDMKPSVGSPYKTIVQASSAASFPNTYLAGLSRVKIEATVALQTNAALSSVVLSYPGSANITMEYNSSTGMWQATTPPVTGNTTYTVTATDVRGMVGSASVALTGVVAYVPPSITIDEANTWRCNSSGVKTDGGTYVRVKAFATYYSSLSGNTLKKFRFFVQEDTSRGANLQSGVQSAAVPFVAENSYGTIVVEIQDQISGIITKTLRLSPKRKNFSMKRSADGTYLGIGAAPQRTSGKSSIEVPEDGVFLVGNYLAQGLTFLHSSATDGTQFGKNFLNINTNTKYAVTNTEAYFVKRDNTGWSNYPVSGAWYGLRKVHWISASHILVEILEFSPTSGRRWFNYYNGSTWSGWRSATTAA